VQADAYVGTALLVARRFRSGIVEVLISAIKVTSRTMSKTVVEMVLVEVTVTLFVVVEPVIVFLSPDLETC
jgi:hypothetical protein